MNEYLLIDGLLWNDFEDSETTCIENINKYPSCLEQHMPMIFSSRRATTTMLEQQLILHRELSYSKKNAHNSNSNNGDDEDEDDNNNIDTDTTCFERVEKWRPQVRASKSLRFCPIHYNWR